jgi:hypothetical protein
LRCDGLDVPAQSVERRAIRLTPRTYEHVAGRGNDEQLPTRQLTQPALELVPLDGRMTVFRDHDTNTYVAGRGFESADVEQTRLEA